MDLEDALLDVSSESELQQFRESTEARAMNSTPPPLSWPMVFSLGVLLGATVASALPEIRSSTELRTPQLYTHPPMPAAERSPVVETVTREPDTTPPQSVEAPAAAPTPPQPNDVDLLATEATPATTPEPARKPARARTTRPRVPASFNSKMDRARPAMAACFRFLATGDEPSITVRVHSGSATIKTRADWPTSVHQCLERALSTLDFGSRSFSATYRMKP